MADANSKRILIVSGEYGIVLQVRQALRASNFAIQTAYSHTDGVYTLENGEFDLVFVDAGMSDRHSGASTAAALQRAKAVPVVALAENGAMVADPARLGNVTVARLGETSILRSVAQALQLPTDGLPPDPSADPVGVNGKPQYYSDETQTLFALSKSLTEVLDLGEVLNRVVEAARRLTNAEEGMILLPDDDVGQLYLRAKVGIDVEVARNFRVKTQDTLAGRVFAAGQPILIGAQGPQKVKTEYLVNSLLYVPIIYEGQGIGVLGVNNRNSEAIFLPRHQELLQNLASFAAIAIENARIHEETLERTRELQVLVEASQVLNSSLSLDKTLPNICEQLMRVLNVNLSEIFEWDRTGSQLRTMARCFRTIWPSGLGPAVDLAARPAVRRALETNEPVAVDRATLDDTLIKELPYLDRAAVEAIQIVPILGGEQSVGAVQLYYIRAPQPLPDTETLQRIQHMALEVLVSLSNQTNQGRMHLVFRAVEDINRLAGADWCELALLPPDRASLIVNLAFGRGVWLDTAQPTLDLAHYGDLAEALQVLNPVYKQADNKMMTPGVRALLERSYSRAILGLPLVQRGQAQGMVLFADARRNRVFTDRDMDMGRAIVGQAATALENARLVHDLEKSLEDLRDAQGRLVQTARLSAMGELAAAVAHQINNPLTTIMVDSEMMLLDEKADAPNYKSLQAISRAGKRAAGVARRLLAIARPNDPESPPERIDVVDTIEGVLSLVKSHIERDRIEIVAEMPSQPLPQVWAVHGQLDDIWLNLLMNAHDALIGRDGAKMGIRAGYQPEDDNINVLVWDNGPGIPANIVTDIFKPFFTTKPVGEGTGLGLHICRQTAERVGGSISVRSTPGEGTEFLVRLPVKRGGIE